MEFLSQNFYNFFYIKKQQYFFYSSSSITKDKNLTNVSLNFRLCLHVSKTNRISRVSVKRTQLFLSFFNFQNVQCKQSIEKMICVHVCEGENTITSIKLPFGEYVIDQCRKNYTDFCKYLHKDLVFYLFLNHFQTLQIQALQEKVPIICRKNYKR